MNLFYFGISVLKKDDGADERLLDCNKQAANEGSKQTNSKGECYQSYVYFFRPFASLSYRTFFETIFNICILRSTIIILVYDYMYMYLPMRMFQFQSVSGYSSEQSIAHYGSRPMVSQL